MLVTSLNPAFELRSAMEADFTPLRRMLEFYQHDLSDVWDQDIDVHGEYGYWLDEYLQGVGSRAFVVTVDSRYSGFALVVPRPKLPGGDYWLEQFFIMKKYRRRGIGRAAAFALSDSLPGKWQVGQMQFNLSAQQFWRKSIRSYTGEELNESEVVTDAGTSFVQQFPSRSHGDA